MKRCFWTEGELQREREREIADTERDRERETKRDSLYPIKNYWSKEMVLVSLVTVMSILYIL